MRGWRNHLGPRTWRVSLRLKASVLAAVTAAIASTVIGVWINARLADEIVANEQEHISHALDVATQRLGLDAESVQRDARYLASLPEIRELVESRDWEDPKSPIHLDVARHFEALLRARPHYTQLRVIAATARGSELVRVDRLSESGAVRRVPVRQLQHKGHREYVHEAISAEAERVYVRRIELARDRGLVIRPHIPTLRAICRIESEDGERSVFIVTNLDMRSVFRHLDRMVPMGYKLLLVDEQGRYLVHPERDIAFAFEFGDRRRLADDFPDLDGTKWAHGPQTLDAMVTADRDDTRFIIGGRRIQLRASEGTYALDLALYRPEASVLAGLREARRHAVIAGVTASLIAMLAGSVLSAPLTSSLRRLTRAIREFGQDHSYSELPTDARDECGEIAEAFSRMRMQIRARQTMLESENRRRNDADQKLRSVIAELEARNTELEQFATIASHDLQEPLRKLITFGDMLRDECAGALDADGVLYIERIQASSRRMRVLIDSLLAYSRAGRSELQQRVIDPRTVLGHVLADHEEALSRSAGTVDVSALPAVVADPILLRQLFTNLVDNAIKFHRDGVPPRVVITAECDHAAPPTARHRIQIRDNGIGFDEKYTDRIFEPFQRLHGRGTFEGTGMGLAVCRRIVERHGWSLEVSSTPGVGTTVTIVCPDIGSGIGHGDRAGAA